MVIRSYTLRKKNSVCFGLLLALACSSGMQATGLSGLVGGLKDTAVSAFDQDNKIDLPSLELPKSDTAKRFFALNGMMGLFSGSPKKWLPKVVMRALKNVDTEENVHGMAEIFTSSLAANLADGRLENNKVRKALAAGVIAVAARWVDTALRLTPWTKDLACPAKKCPGLCDDCKFHKANLSMWAHGVLSGAVHQVVKGK